MTNISENSPLQEAVNFLREKQFSAAAEILTPYVQQHPNSEEAWFLLSYAVEDYQKKIFCLEQVVALSPTNSRAQERLAKLQAAKLIKASKEPTQIVKSQAPPPPKKSRRRWITYPISLLTLLIFVAIGYVAFKIVLPMFRAPERPAIAELPSETPLPSPTIYIEPTATPTPRPTETPAHTPTSTVIPTATEVLPTPTPTREFAPPSASLGQEMDDIQNQVSTIRELGILPDTGRYIIPEIKVHKILKEIFLARNTRDEIKKQAQILSVLGLIEPGYDLYSQAINDLGEGLGGFYIPWTDELFVISEDFGSLEKFVYAHEYVHALTDQHFELGDIGVYPECMRELDRCAAITALVEGDATKLMYDWLTAYASEDEIAEIEESGYSPIDEVITSNDFPPPFLVRETYFNYFDGLNFVNYVFEAGDGWEAVNQVYADFPATTEQILHPEKYFENEPAVKVESRPIGDLLGDEWELLIQETLGELMTNMILGSSANYLFQLDPITAAEAAAGWGGDSFQVYARKNQSILVVHWVWDSVEESAEFDQALADYLNRRFVGRMVEAFDTDCWTKINDHFSCMFTTGSESLWLLAPTLEDIDNILAVYPEFK